MDYSTKNTEDILRKLLRIGKLFKRELSIYIALVIVGVVIVVGVIGFSVFYYQDSIRKAEEIIKQAEIQSEAENLLDDTQSTSTNVNKSAPIKSIVPPAHTPPPTYTPPPIEPKEDPNIKIARCQAKRDSDYSTSINSASNDIAQKTAKLRADLIDLNAPYLKDYSDCFVKMVGQGLGAETCSLYLDIVESNRDYTDQEVLEVEQSLSPFKAQTRALVDEAYYECISK